MRPPSMYRPKLKALRLNGMATAFADLTEQGGDTALAASRWLVEHLLQAEDADRAMRSIAHQMKSARFPCTATWAGSTSPSRSSTAR